MPIALNLSIFAPRLLFALIGGLVSMDAIRSATLNAAQLLDKERDLGSLTAGKFADMIAVEGDPLQDIERLRDVRGVIKAGRMIAPSP